MVRGSEDREDSLGTPKKDILDPSMFDPMFGAHTLEVGGHHLPPHSILRHIYPNILGQPPHSHSSRNDSQVTPEGFTRLIEITAPVFPGSSDHAVSL